MEEGGKEDEDTALVGEKTRECLTGSESARRKGVLVADLDTWAIIRFGVNIDYRDTNNTHSNNSTLATNRQEKESRHVEQT